MRYRIYHAASPVDRIRRNAAAHGLIVVGPVNARSFGFLINCVISWGNGYIGKSFCRVRVALYTGRNGGKWKEDDELNGGLGSSGIG